MVSFTGFAYAFIILILGFLTLVDYHLWPRENGKRIPFKKFIEQMGKTDDAPKSSGGPSMVGITIVVMFVGLCFIFSR